MTEGTVGDSNLHYGDIIVIVGYFAFVLFVGLWSSRQNRGSAGGYFLAGRNMNWILVGASLFASNIGSLHFVGLAGSGAAAGIAIALYEFNAMFVVLALGYIFLPIYISSGVFTMPEYLKRRFGGKRIQMYMAVLALFVYIFTKISADLYAGALFIEQSIGWDIYPAILLLLAIAAIFTITGGLTAVIWTDLIQTVIMLIGAFVLMVISFGKVGGLSGLVDKYPRAIANNSLHSNSTCGLPRADYMHLFRDPVSGDLPWPGLLGVTINSIWYWCADQVIVQRSLAGKTYDHSKLGCVLCGYLKLLPFFLLVLPGMVARILYTETVGCSDPEICMEVCGSRTGCSNIAYPTMVLNLLPAGARGMMLAVMMSALMSSLTSIFNSSATIFAMDLWTHIRRRASELEVMIVGRMFVVLLVVISIIWIPVLKASQGSQLFVYIQEVSSFLQPPICAVFLLAIFWQRFNEKGAFVSLALGMAIGLVRFAVQYSYTVPECGSGEPDPTPAIVKDIHYLYFSAILFVITIVIAIPVTLFTSPTDNRCIQRLTWWTRFSKQPCWDIDAWSHDPEAYEAKMAAIENEPTLPVGEGNEHPGDVRFVKLCEGGDGNERPDDVRPGNHDGDGEGSVLKKTIKVEDEELVGLNSGDSSWKETTVNVDQDREVVEIEDHIKETTDGPSLARRALEWMCGVDRGSRASGVATHSVQQQDMMSIQQKPRWKIVSNVFAIALLLAAIFMSAYFG